MLAALNRSFYFTTIVTYVIILCSSNPIQGFKDGSTKTVRDNLEAKDIYFPRHFPLEVDDTKHGRLGDEETKFDEQKFHGQFIFTKKHDGDARNHKKYFYNTEKNTDSIEVGKNNDRIREYRNYLDEINIYGYEDVKFMEEIIMFDDGGLETADGTAARINTSEIVYTAAVLEFEAYRDWTDGGSEAIYKRNIHSFEFYATQAKLMGADIIVFPEYGLQGLDHNTRNDSVFQALTVPVPAPSARVAPCDFDNEDVFDPMQKLSCVARRLEMYLVVDLAEKAQALDQDGAVAAVYYNTQAVFDRNGFVVARYRKRHLYEEPNFEPSPDADDAALFTTDFGVAFSLQICFDIVFGEPSYANVQKNLTRDIITSTAWIDRAPFNMAPNVQNGFSRSLGVNLLIANYHWPELGKLGSGVYHGYSDLSHAYTYDEHSGNVLVVSPVRTVLSEPPQRFPHSVLSKPKILKYRRSGDAVRVHKIQDSNEKIMKSSDVLSRSPPHAQQRNQASVCFRDLCCSLSYYYFSSNELMYRLVAYNGYYPAGNRLLYVQVCGVLWCESTDINTCAILEPKPSTPSDFFGPFTLSGNFSSDVTFPSAMMRNFSLIPNKMYGFEEKQNGYSEIKFNAGTLNLAMAYIEGRKYSADIP